MGTLAHSEDPDEMPHGFCQYMITWYIWALTRENLSSGVCEQQRLTSLRQCAVWSETLLFAFLESTIIKACNKRNFNFLASPCSWAGWFESHLVGNPEDRFCQDKAQLSHQPAAMAQISFHTVQSCQGLCCLQTQHMADAELLPKFRYVVPLCSCVN